MESHLPEQEHRFSSPRLCPRAGDCFCRLYLHLSVPTVVRLSLFLLFLFCPKFHISSSSSSNLIRRLLLLLLLVAFVVVFLNPRRISSLSSSSSSLFSLLFLFSLRRRLFLSLLFFRLFDDDEEEEEEEKDREEDDDDDDEEKEEEEEFNKSEDSDDSYRLRFLFLSFISMLNLKKDWRSLSSERGESCCFDVCFSHTRKSSKVCDV